MREIKFRAWDIAREMMFEPCYFEPNSDDDNYCCYEDWQEFEDGQYTECHLMQYTGLKDKHGKEIYEGDICENGDYEPDAHAYNNRIEVVQYIENEGAFCGWNYNVDGMTCKVIGNIYENPELLEQTK